MFLKNKNTVGLSLVALLFCVPAIATPITYTFTTGLFGGEQPGYASPALYGIISADAYVSGSFTYDSERSVQGLAPPQNSSGPTGLNYQAFDNIQGTLYLGGSSYAFGSPTGVVGVHNDGYDHYNEYSDLDVMLVTVGPPFAPMSSGFTLGNLSLHSMEMRWTEQLIGGAADFLTSNALPGTLPTFAGRLGIGFQAPNSQWWQGEYATFEGFTVTVASVPEPATEMLFLSGLIFLFSSRRFRKRSY